MKIGEQYEAIEIRGARVYAAAHIREKGMVITFCGRRSQGARVFTKLNTMDFDPVDPEVHICGRCMSLARYHEGSVVD